MIKKSVVGLPVLASLVLLSACGGSHDQGASTQNGAAPANGGAPDVQQATQAPPVREMQPLQPGLPAQKQPRPTTPSNAIAGGNPGTTPLPFNQPFKLGDLEYKFDAARGKNFVGLEANPAMKPTAGNQYFIVRYLVTNNGSAPVVVANNAAIHLMNGATKQVNDIDQAATNANIQSGAATGLPDQLTLEAGVPNVQTLVFEVPESVNADNVDLLVTDPKDPAHLFQLVKLAN